MFERKMTESEKNQMYESDLLVAMRLTRKRKRVERLRELLAASPNHKITKFIEEFGLSISGDEGSDEEEIKALFDMPAKKGANNGIR